MIHDQHKRVPLVAAAAEAPESSLRALLGCPGVLAGAGERLRTGVLTVALQHGRRGGWLAPLLPAGALLPGALQRWRRASFGRGAAAEAEAERMRALEGWGLPLDVLERVAACSFLLGPSPK